MSSPVKWGLTEFLGRLHYTHDKCLAWCLAPSKHQCEVCLSTGSLLMPMSLSLQIPSSRGQCTSQSKWTPRSGQLRDGEAIVAWRGGWAGSKGKDLGLELCGVSFEGGPLLAGKLEALLEPGGVHPTFSRSSLPHRTAFLSDPADGSLYILGTQKQQGLMVCFLQCLGWVRVRASVSQS